MLYYVINYVARTSNEQYYIISGYKGSNNSMHFKSTCVRSEVSVTFFIKKKYVKLLLLFYFGEKCFNHVGSRTYDCETMKCALAYHVDEGKRLAEEVFEGPEVVIPHIALEIIQHHILFLCPIHPRHYPDIQVHFKRLKLTAFPRLPKPSRCVEQDRL
jgi:hypothetical protein